MSSHSSQATPTRGAPRGRSSPWRSRARGRGRGLAGYSDERSNSRQTQGSTHTDANPQGQPNRILKPRLTHFLALPLGHHEDLRKRITAFTTALLDTDPPIAGLDESIVISARRMHLTLGVMSLSESQSTDPLTNASGGSGHATSSPCTLQAATALLHDLKPRIMALLSGKKLLVPLKRVDIMKPERGSLEKAHVLWAGPPNAGKDVERLKAVCQLIHDEFKKAGLLVDEGRPLKLHCTVLNTTYRRPRGRRVPFSYNAVLASPAFRAIEQTSPTSSGNTSSVDVRGKSPVSVDLGAWPVDEIQICEMGSWGPEGEYVCVGQSRLQR